MFAVAIHFLGEFLSPWVAWLPQTHRSITGAYFLFWGLNGFFHFYKLPPSSPRLENFIKSLQETGFLMTWVKVVEVLAGLLLFLGVGVHLALCLLTPVVAVICGAQLHLNRHAGWRVGVGTGLLFFSLFFYEARWLSLLL